MQLTMKPYLSNIAMVPYLNAILPDVNDDVDDVSQPISNGTISNGIRLFFLRQTEEWLLLRQNDNSRAVICFQRVLPLRHKIRLFSPNRWMIIVSSTGNWSVVNWYYLWATFAVLPSLQAKKRTSVMFYRTSNAPKTKCLFRDNYKQKKRIYCLQLSSALIFLAFQDILIHPVFDGRLHGP